MTRRWVIGAAAGAAAWMAWPIIPTWPTWLLLALTAAVAGLTWLAVVSPLLTYVAWMWLGGVPWDRVGVDAEWWARAGTTAYVVVSLVVAFTPRDGEVETERAGL